MHNKRMGRDDMLKIEVRTRVFLRVEQLLTILKVGAHPAVCQLALRRRPPSAP